MLFLFTASFTVNERKLYKTLTLGLHNNQKQSSVIQSSPLNEVVTVAVGRGAVWYI